MTRKEHQTLLAIEALTKDGVPPSYEEIRLYMGLASRSNVCERVQSLAAQGLVTYRPHCERSVRVVKPLDKALADLVATHGHDAVQAALSASRGFYAPHMEGLHA